MRGKTLPDHTDEELMEEAKTRKSRLTNYLIILSVMVGISIYSTFQKGFTFFSFFPLVLAPIAYSFYVGYQAVLREMASRR